MRILESRNKGFKRELDAILSQRREEMTGMEEEVREIIEGVRTNGDKALIRYSRQFDGDVNQESEEKMKTEKCAKAIKKLLTKNAVSGVASRSGCYFLAAVRHAFSPRLVASVFSVGWVAWLLSFSFSRVKF